MSEAVFDRIWKTVYDGGLIYEKGNGLFDTIPQLRDIRQ
jgi:hypothetical protein